MGGCGGHIDFNFLLELWLGSITINGGQFQVVKTRNSFRWVDDISVYQILLCLWVVTIKLSNTTPPCRVNHFLWFVNFNQLAVDRCCTRLTISLTHLALRHTWTYTACGIYDIVMLSHYSIDLLDRWYLLLRITLTLKQFLSVILAFYELLFLVLDLKIWG